MRPLASATLFLGMITLPYALPAQEVDAPVRYDEDYLSADFHRSRRAAVVAQLPGNSLVVLFGAPIRNRSNDMDYEYRQASDFLYLTGSEEPGSALILAPGGLEVDGERVHEILFVPPRDPAREVWDGRRFGAERAMQRLGVELALDAMRFAEILVPLLQNAQHRVYHLGFPDGVPERSVLYDQLAAFMDNVDPAALAGAGTGSAAPLRGVLDGLRAIKSDEEMTALRRAIDITTEAHREVMQQVRAGWAEYEIEALVEYTFKRNGSEQPGFNSIVGSGENSTILHYMTNRRVTEPGDVVVIDIGAEVHGYSADVTRTIPVSGTYSPEQRAIYELVYRAQEAGIRATRAGNPFFASNNEASRVLAEGLAELGLISSAADTGGLRRFFMHGTSHYLGLDVHDVGSYGSLRPGEVVTIEPGIYIPVAEDIDPKWWNIGIRIEDDVLVTDGDPVILSAAAPRQIDEVEALMRSIS
ncbi:MAG TPA: Xaa-Pro aminopeptidase [Gemmatimonadetes bacterium]|nr:Xaa-Pro aminopeptidase [Gemmatimonadota bacterium]